MYISNCRHRDPLAAKVWRQERRRRGFVYVTLLDFHRLYCTAAQYIVLCTWLSIYYPLFVPLFGDSFSSRVYYLSVSHYARLGAW